MGQFGSFEVSERIEHFVYGTTELGPLEAGTFEPASLEEYVACQHLASVSVQRPGQERSHVLVVETAAPEAVVPEPGAPPALGDAPLPEPPSSPPVEATQTTAPTGGEVVSDTDPAAGDDVGKVS
jgi:hypothetical protein